MPEQSIRDTLERAIAALREQLEREFGAHADELTRAATEAQARAARLAAEVDALKRALDQEREQAAQQAAEHAAADMRREAEMHAQVAQLQEGTRQRIEDLQREAAQEREHAVQHAAATAAANVRRQADADIAHVRASSKKEVDEVRAAADAQIGEIRYAAQVQLQEAKAALQAQLEEASRAANAKVDEANAQVDAANVEVEAANARVAAATAQVEDARREAESEVKRTRDSAAAQVEEARRAAAAEAADFRTRAEEQLARLRTEMESRLNDLRSRAAAEVEDARGMASAARAESDAAVRAARVEADATVRAARAEAEEVVIAQLASAQAETEKKIDEAVERTRTDAQQAELAHAAALVDGIRRLDEGRSLGDVLDTLADAAGKVAERAAVLVIRGERLRVRRLAGFSGEHAAELSIAEAGIAGAVVDSGAVIARTSTAGGNGASGVLPVFASAVAENHALALPVAVGGRVVAVLYGDAPKNEGSAPATWPAALEVLARHASRVLEALTVEQAAGLSVARTARTGRMALPGPLEHGGTGEHDAARRYARLLVSEIRMYHEPDVDAGRRSRDLRARLGEAIERARRLYEQRVPSTIRERADYFEQELVRTLADGNPALLG